MKHSTSIYILSNGQQSVRFESEKDACKYLGVVKCSVASCYRRNVRCKGYSIERVRTTAHHEAGTRLYNIWVSMRDRCGNAKNPAYKNYGGRGISVFEGWEEFILFKQWAIENGYSDKLTLDRIDVNGNYEPDNCRWATWTVQQNNRRSNRIVEYNGSRYTLSSLARTCGIKSSTLRARIEAGWSVKDAVEKPINKAMDYRHYKTEKGSEQE